MGIKFKVIIMSLICTLTATLFSGCDTWSFDNTATPPPITTGTVVTDKENDPNFKPSDEDLVGEDGKVDDSQMYDFLDGIKFSYDGKQYKLNTLNDTNFEVTYSRVATYLSQNNTIDCIEFAKNNSELNVDATYISRVVWLYNYVNQYKTLASMILTKLSENYAFGLENFSLNNSLYGVLNYENNEIEDNGDYKTNLNAMNCGVYEVGNSISIPNAYAGQGEAIFDDGNIYVDFNTQSNIDFEFATAIPTKAYFFALNQKIGEYNFVMTIENPYYDSDNIVNKTTIPNPNYDDTDPNSPETIANPDYIENHILGLSELTIVGKVDDYGEIAYELGTTQIDNPNPTDFTNQYIQSYANYLALKLLEAHLFIDEYVGQPNEVNDAYFFEHYETWSQNVGYFGFDEIIFDEDENEYSLIELFADCVKNYVIGEFALEEDANAGEFSRDLENNITQIVTDCINAKVVGEENAFSFDAENGQPYFVKVYNIEWKDYSAEELFDIVTDEEESGEAQSNEEENSEPEDKFEFFTDEIVYSVVFMLKEEYEPVVMQSLLLMLLAPDNDLNVEMNFRYIKNGESKIDEKIDYSLMPPEEDEYQIKNTFTGILTKYDGGELTMENTEDDIFALEDYNIPKLNTIKNQEILIEKFVNNLKSSVNNSLNASLGNLRYDFDSEKNMFYYNEKSTDCDFVELNFATTSEIENASLKLRLTLYDIYFDTLASIQGENSAKQ